MIVDPIEYLKNIGEAGNGPHDIARAALALAALDRPGRALEPYLAHLRDIEESMLAERGMILRTDDGARTLAGLIVRRLGYEGDRLEYNDPRNADLMAVIDRRRGLPVALGILYIHAARAAGLEACGLNMPSHFLVRIAYRGDERTIDPFNAGAPVDRDHVPVELRGSDTGLAQPIGDTDVLLRLQNNLKMRALEKGDSVRGVELARRMVLIAPRRADLWFDLARLNEAVGVLGAARNAYETCLEVAQPDEGLRNEAAISLSHLKRRLN